ncbi:MAG: immunity 52 family protein [Pseudomonadota bacterium]
MKHAYQILLSLHYAGDLSVDTMLPEMWQFIQQLSRLSPNLNGWLLAGPSKEEASLYEVYKDGKPTAAAKAALENRLEGKIDPRIITMWNGKDDHEGASLRFMGRPKEHLSLITFDGYPQSFSPDWRAIAEVLIAGAAIWTPHYISVESNGYRERKIFKDRPGIGWMQYLPTVLTVQQVPEARALVPVLGAGNKQIGTIIVSVIDAPFSDENPDHVKIANAIEIRLVDQDLLPRYADL